MRMAITLAITLGLMAFKPNQAKPGKIAIKQNLNEISNNSTFNLLCIEKLLQFSYTIANFLKLLGGHYNHGGVVDYNQGSYSQARSGGYYNQGEIFKLISAEFIIPKKSKSYY